MYSLGVDLAEPTTSWTRTSVGAASSDTHGSVSSAVCVGDSGALVLAPPGAETSAPGDVVTGFLSSLGSSEPVMVGGTPYGVEALVACVLAAVVAVNTQEVGSPPDLVVLLHDDDLDAYRASMLREAARIAGVGPGRVLLVTRSAAAGAAGPAATLAAGAARLGSHTLPEPPSVPGGGGGDLAAGAGGVVVGGAAGVAGAIGLGGAVAEGGAVSAAGATVAGVPAVGAGSGAAGPAGSAVGSSIGPAGSSVGPAGSSVGPAGVSGAVGPTGSGSVGVSGSGTIGAASSAFPWVPVAVGGALAAVVAVIGVAVIAGGDDRPPEEAVAATEVVTVVDTSVVTQPSSTEPSSTEPPSTDVATTVEVESSTTLDPDIDLSAYVGDWVVCVPSADAPNVSAAVEYSFSPVGPNQLSYDYVLLVYTDSSDCSTAGMPSNSATYTATVVGETVIDGVPSVQVTSEDSSFVMGVVGDTLRYGASVAPGSFPTTFDVTEVYSRRS